MLKAENFLDRISCRCQTIYSQLSVISLFQHASSWHHNSQDYIEIWTGLKELLALGVDGGIFYFMNVYLYKPQFILVFWCYIPFTNRFMDDPLSFTITRPLFYFYILLYIFFDSHLFYYFNSSLSFHEKIEDLLITSISNTSIYN